MDHSNGAGRYVVVAIPAFNESATIGRVVHATRRVIADVIVVDDGSTDRTSDTASQAGAIVIRHHRNRGKAQAIMTACQAARDRGADVLVLLDGDGQHSPSDIPRLLAPILCGQADVVVGSRFLDPRNTIPTYRVLGQRVLNVVTHLGSGQRCGDSQCGFRALNRRAFTTIELHETFHHGLAAESEMQFQIARNRLRLAEAPVRVRYGKTRRSPARHGSALLYRIGVMAARRWKRSAIVAAAGVLAASPLVMFALD